MSNESDNNCKPEAAKTGTQASAPVWLSASDKDFAAVDLNAPVVNSTSVDCSEVSGLYQKMAEKASGAGHGSNERVYAMLGALCSFHFNPADPGEPFGPMARFEDQRTAAPDDFRGKPEGLLLRHRDDFDNLA